MNHSRRLQHQQILQDRMGLKMAACLTTSASDLPHDIQERLRVARLQALEHRRQPSAGAAVQLDRASEFFQRHRSGGSATNDNNTDWRDRWGRITSAAVVVVLAIGLVMMVDTQSNDLASEVAEVDAALLTDDLPPQAYTDPGFLQFLKAQGDRS